MVIKVKHVAVNAEFQVHLGNGVSQEICSDVGVNNLGQAVINYLSTSK